MYSLLAKRVLDISETTVNNIRPRLIDKLRIYSNQKSGKAVRDGCSREKYFQVLNHLTITCRRLLSHSESVSPDAS